MRKQYFSVALLLLSLSASVFGAQEYGKRVLVLVENVAFSSTYSQYLDSIKQQGFVIEQRSALDPNLHLREWDNWKYDKLIVFASGINGVLL